LKQHWTLLFVALPPEFAGHGRRRRTPCLFSSRRSASADQGRASFLALSGARDGRSVPACVVVGLAALV